MIGINLANIEVEIAFLGEALRDIVKRFTRYSSNK